MGAIASVVALAAVGIGSSTSSAGVAKTAAVGSSQYLVRVDRRLCPSPRCGGYYVALANRPTTPCGDGSSSATCYVARAEDARGRPLAPLRDDALVRAAIELRDFDGVGKLPVLVVADVRLPAGDGTRGSFFRVRDTGIECVRAPCFSYRARRLNGKAVVKLSSVDLVGAHPGAVKLARAQAALRSRAGVFVQGFVVRSSNGGRILRSLRIFLRPV